MVFRKLPFYFGYRSVKYRTSRWLPRNEVLSTLNDKVYPQIPFLIRAKKYNIKTKVENNPAGQLFNQTYDVTKLLKEERIVLGYNKGTEIRPQVERLIAEAIRHGDKHRPTMAAANYWLRDKNMIHKLFKVLVPRYENYSTAFTAIHVLGPNYDTFAKTYTEAMKGCYYHRRGEVVLELKGNNLPPIIRPKLNKTGLLSNVLIDSARYAKLGDLKMNRTEQEPTTTTINTSPSQPVT